jgi:hypothetical protein
VLGEWVEQDEIMTQKRTKLDVHVCVRATTQQSLHRCR